MNKFGCRPICISGGIVTCIALILSTFVPNVPLLMLTYGLMGGFGFGMVYLPSVVCVGYYFEKRRALATGIAVCGSGVGCFVFAPLANFLLVVMCFRRFSFKLIYRDKLKLPNTYYNQHFWCHNSACICRI